MTDKPVTVTEDDLRRAREVVRQAGDRQWVEQHISAVAVAVAETRGRAEAPLREQIDRLEKMVLSRSGQIVKHTERIAELKAENARLRDNVKLEIQARQQWQERALTEAKS